MFGSVPAFQTTYQLSPPPVTFGSAGAGVPPTGLPSLRLTTESWPVRLVPPVDVDSPNAEMSSALSCVAGWLASGTTPSAVELSVASVQVEGESVLLPAVGALAPPYGMPCEVRYLMLGMIWMF